MRIIVALTLTLVAFVSTVSADSRTDFFEAKIRPLLIERCESCHDRQAKGGLRLDSRRGFTRGGRSGTVVVAGKPEKSLLFLAVSGQHKKLKMPPDDPLEPAPAMSSMAAAMTSNPSSSDGGGCAAGGGTSGGLLLAWAAWLVARRRQVS